jgi:virulence factor Mce-like protein
MRRNRQSIVANPVLVGAVTVLVAVVAVFLAYNANNGLPFVPTRSLDVQLANGSNLVPGNEVRSGGYRVGVVDDMRPARLTDGRVGAVVHLKLDRKIGAIPVDSRVVIRPRSALGLKYVELTRGRAGRTLPDGGTLPLAQSRTEVELDEVYNTFDRPTREASRADLHEFGDAFVGRGADLSETIRLAPSLFGHLAHVMRVLAAPQTHLQRFFRELGDAARVVAPVSASDAHVFTVLAATFDAISRSPQALRDTIARSPGTLAAGTRSFRAQRPFLAHTAALSADLRRASGELRGALGPVNAALRVGTPVTQRSAHLYDDLQGSLDAVRDLAEAPTTLGALRGLDATVTTLQPQLRFLGPYVTVCNSWNFLWTLVAEHFTAPTPTGTEQRALFNAGPVSAPGLDSNDSIESDNANEFAHGKVSQEPGAVDEQLHANYYGSAVDDRGRANCEAGQQGYMASANPFRDKSVKGDPYARVSVDHPITGGLLSGPTYAKIDREGHGVGLNPDHVPAGETFTARPGGRGADTPLLSSYPPGEREP